MEPTDHQFDQSGGSILRRFRKEERREMAS
jgi:hypothetical protein